MKLLCEYVCCSCVYTVQMNSMSSSHVTRCSWNKASRLPSKTNRVSGSCLELHLLCDVISSLQLKGVVSAS